MLYKFYAEDRFFENGLVRFTQPTRLNDSDDSRPELMIGRFSQEDYAKAEEEAKKAGFSSISPRILEAMYLTPYPFRRMDEKSFPGLWPADEPRLRSEPFETLAELDIAIAERAVELCLSKADQTTGVFSLSRSSGDDMWSYYGGDHTGLAIGFDEEHPFFKGVAKPIEYTPEPIYVTSNFGWVRLGGERWKTEEILNGRIGNVPNDLFFKKRPNWAHEEEWRIIRPLAEAARTLEKDERGFEIFLFEVPKSAVLSATFGYWASQDRIERTTRQIRADAALDHVRIFKRKKTSLRTVIFEAIE